MPQNTLPDYHFLLIPSNMGAEWLFDAARSYWERFRPTVISDFELVKLIPEARSVNVTVIAQRDRMAFLGVEMGQAVPRALFDPIPFDLFNDIKAELGRRAEQNEPFGVPLLPTPTPTTAPTAQQVMPTPGPITGVGFITQTPTPDLSTPATPLPTSDGAAQEPLDPTPGPVAPPGS